MGQHRRKFIEIISDLNMHLLDEKLCENDHYSLGFHLVRDHNLTNKSDFNHSYEVFILDICSPRRVQVNEHRYIHNNGINKITVLYCNSIVDFIDHRV